MFKCKNNCEIKIFVFIIILAAILCISFFPPARQAKPYDDGRRYLSMQMPNVHTLGKETYLCTAFPMPVTDFEYIVEFTPNVSMHTAHHVLIYGCEAPGVLEKGTPRLVWDCGHTNPNNLSEYIQGPICKSNQNVIYAWAKDASVLELPEGIGFKIGKGTGINYLILQIHYVDKFIRDDVSGVTLTMLPSHTDKVSKIAGVYFLGSGGIIKAGEEEHFEAACRIEELKTIHPIAVRTHTHGLGKVVSGYKIDKDGKWHLIGKHNPQEPQMFYPVDDKNLVITYGDILAARCTFYNFKDHDVYHGHTHNDEMCNFYMMYYVDEDRPLQSNKCFTDGPKLYYWNTDSKIKFVPNDINLSASTLN